MRTSEKVHELFLNYACNAKCPFCYNPPITPELLRLDLTFEKAAKSLYEGARSGARLLNLHGGEVTLRDDLPKILALAKKLGFREITVVTNGVALSRAAYARKLVACGATHFRLSIHAGAAGLHDEIVAIPGAFAKCLKALENLRALDVPVGLNYVLIARNAAALPAFLKFFCVERSLSEVIVYFPHFRGMMEINAAQDGLTYAQAAPHVRAGAALLRSAGRLDSLWLANFVPCVVPELESRMLDWSGGQTADAAIIHPEGFTQDLREMKHEQKVSIAACPSCALGTRCLGIDREYRAFYGAEGFVPVAAAPEAAAC